VAGVVGTHIPCGVGQGSRLIVNRQKYYFYKTKTHRMKESSDDLHKIIIRLSPDEKRLFRQQISSNKKPTQATLIFDFLNSLPEFNNEKYEAFIKKKKIEANAPSVKSQLKEKLIDWLTTQSNGPAGTGWFHLLVKGEVLLKYEMFEEAARCFTQVRDEARGSHMGVYEWMSLSFLSEVIQALNPENVIKSFVEISNRTAEISGKMNASATAQNYYMRTVALFYEARTANKETHRLLVDQLYKDVLFNATDAYMPMEVRIYIFQARALINLMLGNLEPAYIENHKQYLDIIAFETKFIKHQPHEYTITLRDKLYYCFIAGKNEEYISLYPGLYQKVQSVELPDASDMLRLEAIHVLFLTKTNQRQELKKALQQLHRYELSKRYSMELAHSRKEGLMYSGYGYMALCEWDKAIVQFEKLIEIKLTSVAGDFDHAARFMVLFCHFASSLNNLKIPITEPSAFLENQASAYYNYLVKKRLNAPIEKEFIGLVKNFSQGGLKRVQRNKLSKGISRLKSALHEAPPFYQMQLAEFNWVDCLVEAVL
jgi:hypothetical protein